MNKGSMFIVVFCLAIVVATVATYYFGIKWPLENAVNAPLNRAQVAAEAEDMLEWMEKVRDGMEDRGMTSGYATILKHTYDYDYSAIYKSVQNLITRLGRTVKMDKSSDEYQMAMDDIRGTMRELDLRIGEYLFKNYVWWLIIIAIVFLIIAYVAFVEG